MLIFGVTGTLGAGKGTVVEALKKRGFVHFSARDLLREEVEKRGLPLNRTSLTDTANDIAKQQGPAYIAETLYTRAREAGKNSVIESIRRPAEAEFLKSKKDFYLIAVDADTRVRYERIIKRANETDHVIFEEFVRDENREMTSANPAEGNIRKCIKMADFTLQNNGSVDELHEKTLRILKSLNAIDAN